MQYVISNNKVKEPKRVLALVAKSSRYFKTFALKLLEITNLILIKEFLDLEYFINEFRLLPLPEMRTAVFIFLPINFSTQFNSF